MFFYTPTQSLNMTPAFCKNFKGGLILFNNNVIIYSYSMAEIVHIARACFTQEEEITSIFIWFRGAEENNHVFWWFYIYITWKIIIYAFLPNFMHLNTDTLLYLFLSNFHQLQHHPTKNWKITGKGIHRGKTLCNLAGK